MAETYEDILVHEARKVTDIETLHTLIGLTEKHPTIPVEAYCEGTGTVILESLGFSRKEQQGMVKVRNLYRQSIDRLRASGLIKLTRHEYPDVMEASMSPTVKGYEWLKQYAPEKYREIIEERIAEEERLLTCEMD